LQTEAAGRCICDSRAATKRRDFAADLLQMQQTKFLGSRLGCN